MVKPKVVAQKISIPELKGVLERKITYPITISSIIYSLSSYSGWSHPKTRSPIFSEEEEKRTEDKPTIRRVKQEDAGLVLTAIKELIAEGKLSLTIEDVTRRGDFTGVRWFTWEFAVKPADK